MDWTIRGRMHPPEKWLPGPVCHELWAMNHMAHDGHIMAHDGHIIQANFGPQFGQPARMDTSETVRI